MTPVNKQPYSATIRTRPKKDGTTSHDVRFRQDGQSRSLSFTDYTSADKWAKIVRAVGPEEALKLLRLKTLPGTPTLDEYAEIYINSKSGIEPKTLEHYRMYMRLHITPSLGHLPLDAISKEMIAGWVNAQAARGDAGKSIKNRHGFLSALFQHAVDDEVIPRNPCAKTVLPETVRDDMVFLSADEFTTLLSYIPSRYQPLVLTLASTGMRWGEATALKPSDFDLGARTVRITRAWKSSQSKGWYLGPPKTKRSRRTLKLTPNLIPILQPLVEAGTEFVFTNSVGNPVRQQNFWEDVWNPARRLANGLPAFDTTKGTDREWTARARGVWDGRQPATTPIGKSPRVHDLRHSYVAWQLAQGTGIDVISRNLGHESIQTTIDIYGHIAQDRVDAAAEAIGVELSGAMPQLEG